MSRLSWMSKQLVRSYSMIGWKQEREKFLSMSSEERRRLYKCGDNYKTLTDLVTWDCYAKAKNLNSKSSSVQPNSDLNARISIFTGDITTLEIDAIVNAANERLAGGGGVDGAIHSAADRNLLQAECRSLGGCRTGEAKITSGYKLPAKYIIHTVGPVGEKPDLLASCYAKSLDLLKSSNLRSIAFPCVSTGIYGYPNEKAAHVCLKTSRTWLEQNASSVDRIIFCLFMEVDIKAYHALLPEYFPFS
ncbi:ADP-ribose glycohydrolase MACROD2 [Halotydeus destructor]|nr:ADP-ribose glycohydrolase MACROD2 [Halotydeus destructor]